MERFKRKLKESANHLTGLKTIDIVIFLLLLITLVAVSVWVGSVKTDLYDGSGYLSIGPADIAISFFAALLTFLYVALVSRGRKEGFIYGIFAQVFWGINAIASGITFQIVLRFGMFLPTTILGFTLWYWDDKISIFQNEKSSDQKIVFVASIVILLLSFLLTYLLFPVESLGVIYVDGIKERSQLVLFLDITLFLFGFVSTVTLVMGYTSSWMFWNITNIWGFAFYVYFAVSFDNWLALIGAIGWLFYSFNSIRVWYDKVYINEIKIKDNKRHTKKHKSMK